MSVKDLAANRDDPGLRELKRATLAYVGVVSGLMYNHIAVFQKLREEVDGWGSQEPGLDSKEQKSSKDGAPEKKLSPQEQQERSVSNGTTEEDGLKTSSPSTGQQQPPTEPSVDHTHTPLSHDPEKKTVLEENHRKFQQLSQESRYYQERLMQQMQEGRENNEHTLQRIHERLDTLEKLLHYLTKMGDVEEKGRFVSYRPVQKRFKQDTGLIQNVDQGAKFVNEINEEIKRLRRQQ